MALINIPNKSAGDQFLSGECNQIVESTLSLQASQGWGLYSDTLFTDVSPQIINGDGTTWTPIGNNAGEKIETYLPLTPDGTTPQVLYDGVKITPPSVGATFSGYVQFIAKVDSNEALFNLGIDIGGAQGVIFDNNLRFARGQNTYRAYNMPINGFMLDTFFTNGGTVVVKPENGDQMSIYGAVLYIAINQQNQKS